MELIDIKMLISNSRQIVICVEVILKNSEHSSIWPFVFAMVTYLATNKITRKMKFDTDYLVMHSGTRNLKTRRVKHNILGT